MRDKLRTLASAVMRCLNTEENDTADLLPSCNLEHGCDDDDDNYNYNDDDELMMMIRISRCLFSYSS